MKKKWLLFQAVLLIVLLMQSSPLCGNAAPPKAAATPVPESHHRINVMPAHTPTPTPQRHQVRLMATPLVTIAPGSLEEIAVPAGMDEPYPDAPVNPVEFDGYWYNYVSAFPSVSGGFLVSTAVHKLSSSGTDGYAEDTSTISGSLVRVSATPKWVFKAQHPQPFPTLTPTNIPNPSTQWYSRMGMIFGGINENDTKLHAFFHAEDTHTSPADTPTPGTFNGLMFVDGPLRNYARIGLVSSSDPENFLSSTPKKLIECMMDEDGWRTNHPTDGTYVQLTTNDNVGGIRHPWPIEVTVDSNEYVYVFYDRILSSDWRMNVSPTPPQQAYANATTYNATPGTGEICVARALKEGFLEFANDSTGTVSNPFQKYYDGYFDQSAIGGYSSPIIDPGASYLYRETPSVSFNTAVNKYFMLVWGQESAAIPHSIKLHINENAQLSQWSTGLRLDLSIADSDIEVENGAHGKYPSLISADTFEGATIGSANKTGEANYLYFSDFLGDLSSGTRTLHRIGITFPH